MFHSDRKKADEEIRQAWQRVAGAARWGERTSEPRLSPTSNHGRNYAKRRRQEKIQQATYQISRRYTADDLPSFLRTLRVHAIVKP